MRTTIIFDLTKPGWVFFISLAKCLWTIAMFAAAMALIMFFGVAFE